MIAHVWNRLRLIFAHGVASRVGADTVQVKVLDGEVLANIKRVEPYGFSYMPHKGGQAYLLFPSGDRSYGVALVIGDKQYQMTLEAGEVALHDDVGNHVHLKRGGVIEVKASAKVLADTPLFETTGDALIGGNLTVAGQTSSAGGYFGENGSAATMAGGLYVLGAFTVNGKNVSDTHTHFVPAVGASSNGVD